MYIPPYYRNSDLTEIKNFIRQNPFGILVTNGKEVPESTHIPFELVVGIDGKEYLQGHISRGNPQWKSFSNGETVLAIFMGPHTYVSSSWYNHVNVPTWNYIAVHVSGKLEVINEEELYQSLKTLVDRYETASEKPVRVEELPVDFLKNNMKGIVGFRISLDKIEGKWKLSQNRDEEDFQNIIKELEKVNDINSKLVAEEMKKLC
jgi:transcriptional regulator